MSVGIQIVESMTLRGVRKTSSTADAKSGRMKRGPKSAVPEVSPLLPVVDATAILQVKVWLTGISPMMWRRVLVPSSFTLRELHGVIQVAMGWEGIHLCDFQLRATHYGSSEVAAKSPDVTLAALRFRKGARFTYEYDLNIPVAPRGPHRRPIAAGGSQNLSHLHRGQGRLPIRGLRRSGELHGSARR
jgi:hypothetical protein